MKRVILDTNFLLIPGSCNVDIIAEIDRICPFSYELCILDRSIDELEGIMKSGKGKHASYARIGMELVRNNDIRLIRTDDPDSPVDDLIVDTAASDGSIVATEDRELASRLKEKDIRIIKMRQRNHLQLG